MKVRILTAIGRCGMVRSIGKYIWILLCTAALCLVLFLCFYVVMRRPAPDTPVRFPFRFRVNDETIECYEDGDDLFVFLPSYADPSDVFVTIDADNEIICEGATVADGKDLSDLEIGKEYDLAINGSKKSLTVLRSAGVAAMFIDTVSGDMEKIDADKTYKERAAISLYTASGDLDYRGTWNDRIKTRGNTTWYFEKKPYNLDLQKAKSLLGMHDGNEWVLLANALDETDLRNKLIYDFAKSVQSYDGFSPDCGFVDLYLNGEYNGLYLLCEKRVSIERLSIGEDGYFFNLELSNRKLSDKDPIVVGKGVAIEIQYPKHYTPDQKEILKQRLDDFKKALLKDGDEWKNYIDVDSFARKYLIEEIFANPDGGATSEYYHWDGGDSLIFAGPCWDYDLSLGNGIDNSECFTASRAPKNDLADRPWYPLLMEKEEFRAYVIELYKNEFLPKLEALKAEIPRAADAIAVAAQNNALRWYRYSESIEQLTDDMLLKDFLVFNCNEALTQMSSFLEARIAFLNAAWIDGVDYKTITLTGVMECYYYCVPINEKIENLPTPEDLLAGAGTVWYVQGTDEPFDSDQPITEDLILYAKSEDQPEEEVEPTGSPSGSNKKKIVFLASCLLLLAFFAAVLVIDAKRRKGARKTE